MKVRIGFTVDIDPHAWAAEYGIPESLVRLDINDYVRNSVTSHLEEMGFLK